MQQNLEETGGHFMHFQDSAALCSHFHYKHDLMPALSRKNNTSCDIQPLGLYLYVTFKIQPLGYVTHHFKYKQPYRQLLFTFYEQTPLLHAKPTIQLRIAL
jgi:hypothetical protein